MATANTRPWLAAGTVACISLAALIATGRTTSPRTAHPLPVPAPGATVATAQNLLGRLPLAFERVDGNGHEGFISRGPGRRLQVTASGATFELDGSRPARNGRGRTAAGAAARVRMHLVDGDAAARAQALEPQPGSSHYFRGNDPAGWHRNVSRFQKVRYDQVYPGVDLVYYGNQRNLEYDFVVAPGADPSRIGLAYSGVDGMRLDPAGNLVLATALGDLLQHKPVVYQEVGGERRPVDGGYVLRGERVAFRIGDYDPALPLVIDPVISYSTFLGGNDVDIGNDIAVDGQGNFYVTGQTASTDFPVVSAPQGTPGGDRSDIFVAKYDAAGTLVYSTYLAGSGYDEVGGIDVDDAGNAYVTGITDSADFPTVNPIQSGPLSPGGRAVFVTRIAPAGDTLEFSTYLGGYSADYGENIAVDENGNAYITGGASYYFPTTPGVINPTTEWGDDVFVAKVDTNLGQLVYSTYIDGVDTGSSGYAIAVDTAGNAYVAGGVNGANFPIVGGFQPNRASFDGDAFLAKLNPDASQLLYSTYYGGTDTEYAVDLAIDTAGNAYITGLTDSIDLPLAHPLQGAYAGGYRDAFVAKIDTVGGSLVYATYLGGKDEEGYANDIGIAVDGNGSAYVAGATYSADFPVVDAIQPTRVGTQAGFVSKLAPDGGSLVSSTYLGAEQYSYSRATSVAVDGAGNAYVAGITDGSEFPMVGAAQPTLVDNYKDAFVTRIAFGGAQPAGPRPRSDFDGDGRDDVVWRHAGNGADTIWLAANAATQRAMTDIRTLDWEVVGLGDVDGNGSSDVFWRNRATGANVIWRNADYGSQVATTRITDLAWRVVGTGDLDGDGKADVVWRNNRTGANTLWRSGSYATRRSLAGVGNLAWKIVGVGDFDKDGRDDILWRNGATGANTLWPSGDAAHSRSLTRITDLGWQVVTVGDFNGDGADDVFWRHSSTGRNAIWKSASYATQQAVTGVTNRDWKVEASGDYDGDGKDDVLWRNSTTGSNAIWRSGNSATPRTIQRVTDTGWRVVP